MFWIFKGTEESEKQFCFYTSCGRAFGISLHTSAFPSVAGTHQSPSPWLLPCCPPGTSSETAIFILFSSSYDLVIWLKRPLWGRKNHKKWKVLSTPDFLTLPFAPAPRKQHLLPLQPPLRAEGESSSSLPATLCLLLCTCVLFPTVIVFTLVYKS